MSGSRLVPPRAARLGPRCIFPHPVGESEHALRATQRRSGGRFAGLGDHKGVLPVGAHGGAAWLSGAQGRVRVRRHIRTLIGIVPRHGEESPLAYSLGPLTENLERHTRAFGGVLGAGRGIGHPRAKRRSGGFCGAQGLGSGREAARSTPSGRKTDIPDTPHAERGGGAAERPRNAFSAPLPRRWWPPSWSPSAPKRPRSVSVFGRRQTVAHQTLQWLRRSADKAIYRGEDSGNGRGAASV